MLLFCTHTCEQNSHKQKEMMEKKMWKFTFRLWLRRFWWKFEDFLIKICNCHFKFENFNLKSFLSLEKVFLTLCFKCLNSCLKNCFILKKKVAPKVSNAPISQFYSLNMLILGQKSMPIFMEVKDKWVHFMYRRHQLFPHIYVYVSHRTR
jgi:hypothetical protein